MGIISWTWVAVLASFALYVGIAVWAKAKSTGDFYVAEKQVHPVLNGMATGTDWMSAASFLSMAGLISFLGRDGSMYLMGWTGGYTLLAVLLAPYLRKYGKYTVPQFVGDRYYSNGARVVALLCAILISFTYVAGQMRGVGIVLSRFLNTSIEMGVWWGVAIVFGYATLGGMKGITYTQVAQYVVMMIAYLVPAIFVSLMLTGHFVPQLGYGATLTEGGARLLGVPQGTYLLDALDAISKDLGFDRYTSGAKPAIDVFMITFALMVGTAGLPHIIIRFFTVPKIRDARSSAGWALIFIALLYTTAPAVAAFARANLVRTVHGRTYADAPGWFKSWEKTRLVTFTDKNGDGVMQLAPGDKNEVAVDADIMVLANPEMADLPPWVAALVMAGGLAAALSTAAGLLLVIAAAISHDLMKGVVSPHMSEKAELNWARLAAAGAVIVAGWAGIHPPGGARVAEVVALAFGFAASSFFPVIVMGIFWKRATKEGAILGMLVGVLFTASYVVYFKFMHPELNGYAHWLWRISPEGIGTVGMVLNFAVLTAVSLATRAPPAEVQQLVGNLRYPKESDAAARGGGSKAIA